MAPERLYTDGPLAGAKAPILVTHFEGAMDAGSAGTLAVVQMLRNLSAERVATFDTDLLIDYRSHRPIMVVENWVTQDVVAPEIALDLVHDDTGLPVLVLHGPEPDARWEGFSATVADLAREAGVEIVVSFHGIPAAVPHTRPITVHLQSTDEDLIPEQPLMGGTIQFPAPLSTFLHHRLSEKDIHGVSLVAAVPYYMADSAFPRAASALLRRLAELANLSLPIGDLERGADEDASQVAELVGKNPDVQRTVEALERHYDAMVAGTGPSLFGTNAVFLDVEGQVDGESGDPTDDQAEDTPELAMEIDTESGEEIGEAIERYLRTQLKIKPAVDANDSDTSRAVAEENDDDDGDAPQPRHRAPKPWEK